MVHDNRMGLVPDTNSLAASYQCACVVVCCGAVVDNVEVDVLAVRVVDRVLQTDLLGFPGSDVQRPLDVVLFVETDWRIGRFLLLFHANTLRVRLNQVDLRSFRYENREMK